MLSHKNSNYLLASFYFETRSNLRRCQKSGLKNFVITQKMSKWWPICSAQKRFATCRGKMSMFFFNCSLFIRVCFFCRSNTTYAQCGYPNFRVTIYSLAKEDHTRIVAFRIKVQNTKYLPDSGRGVGIQKVPILILNYWSCLVQFM